MLMPHAIAGPAFHIRTAFLPQFKLKASTSVAIGGAATLVREKTRLTRRPVPGATTREPICDSPVCAPLESSSTAESGTLAQAAAIELAVAPAVTSIGPQPSLTFKAAKVRVASKLGASGFNNRGQGAFGFPPEDMAEPARTERLLAAPFALRREKPADQLLQRAGSYLFRVNGGSCVGISYRLIVIGFNLLVGILAGLKPLITARTDSGDPDPTPALVQCAAIFSMQIGLAIMCFTVAPDADRFFSVLAGAQVRVQSPLLDSPTDFSLSLFHCQKAISHLPYSPSLSSSRLLSSSSAPLPSHRISSSRRDAPTFSSSSPASPPATTRPACRWLLSTSACSPSSCPSSS